jgi:hypothetical protein
MGTKEPPKVKPKDFAAPRRNILAQSVQVVH